MEKVVYLFQRDSHNENFVNSLTQKDIEEWWLQEEFEEKYTIIKIEANQYSTPDEAIMGEGYGKSKDDYFIRSFGF